MNNYETVIGVEVHAQLNTKRKIFSPSLNNTDADVNTNVHPIDLGLPGTLPRFNEEVLQKSIIVAKSFNMDITEVMHWDRKNYFYHDNPKGYQITQQETPIGRNGKIILDNGKVINIDFMHMEEDTAKSFHREDKTLLDFNRCGIPLVEIVSKPDMASKEEAKEYLEKLRETLLYIGASDCKMQDGSLRIDLNISVRPLGQETLNPKVEIKNLNSFNNLLKAVDLETKSQINSYNSNQKVLETTKRFDEDSQSLKVMRIKEGVTDYRYFTEPDLPYIKIDQEYILNSTKEMPMLPGDIKKVLIEKEINSKDIVTLMNDVDMCKFYLELLDKGLNPKNNLNYLIVNINAILNKENLSFKDLQIEVKDFEDMERLLDESVISSNHIKKIIPVMITSKNTVDEIVDELGIKQITDRVIIREMVTEVLDANAQSIEDFKNGKDRSIGFLVGQIIKKSKGQANPKIVNEILMEEINQR